MLKDHLKLLLSAIFGFLTAITLNQWVAVASLLYACLQIGLIVPKYVAIVRSWRRD